MGVFEAIGKGAAKIVLKLLDKDPVIQKHGREISKITSDMEKHIRDKEKKNPEFAKQVEEARKEARKKGLDV